MICNATLVVLAFLVGLPAWFLALYVLTIVIIEITRHE